MADDDLLRLLDAKWRARFGEPLPDLARSQRAVASYDARAWRDAAREFERLLRTEGPASELAPPALFSLGDCRHELGEHHGALEASVLFLELSNEEHPFYRDGVQNIARAAERLGHAGFAAQLRRVALGELPRWPREKILRAAFAVLGWDRTPLPPSTLSWRRD